mgnify:CR=1 FL=1
MELTDHDRRMMAGTRDRILMEQIQEAEAAVTRRAWHGGARHGTARCGVARPGSAWLGQAWQGEVWQGEVWRGCQWHGNWGGSGRPAIPDKKGTGKARRGSAGRGAAW